MKITAKERKYVADYLRFKKALSLLNTEQTQEGVTELAAIARQRDNAFDFPAARTLMRVYKHGCNGIVSDKGRYEHWLKQAYNGSSLTQLLGIPDPILWFWSGGHSFFAKQVAVAVLNIEQIDRDKAK